MLIPHTFRKGIVYKIDKIRVILWEDIGQVCSMNGYVNTVNKSHKMLKLVNVSKVYTIGKDVIHALENINVDIDHGEFISVVGPSGSGKSTLLHIIGLIDIPTEGKYSINEREVSTFADRDKANLRSELFGFVFQDFYLFPRLTAIENVLVPTIFSRKNAILNNSTNVMKMAKIDNRIDHKPSELSGGEKQRVAIARALINDPGVIMADEPTGNLDSKTAEDIMKIFKYLNQKKKKTIIIATHNELVSSYADRIIKLKDGKIVEDSKMVNNT